MKPDPSTSRFGRGLIASLMVAATVLHSGCIGSGSTRIGRDAVRYAENTAITQRARGHAALYRQALVSIIAPELQDEIQELVDELTEVANCPIPCRVHLVNSPSKEAFCLASGDIFVNCGMLEVAANRDELAVLLGHEIAHVKHQDHQTKTRHTSREQERAAVTSAILGAALSGAASSAVSASLASTLESVPPLLVNEIQQHVFSIQCDIAGRLAASLPGPMIRSLMLLSIENYSQEAELRADRCAVEYAIAAGYDSKAAVQFLRKLAEIRDRSRTTQSEGP